MAQDKTHDLLFYSFLSSDLFLSEKPTHVSPAGVGATPQLTRLALSAPSLKRKCHESVINLVIASSPKRCSTDEQEHTCHAAHRPRPQAVRQDTRRARTPREQVEMLSPVFCSTNLYKRLFQRAG